jgi:hypothetical protein
VASKAKRLDMTVSMLIHWVRRGETAGETIEVVVASRYGGFSRGFQRRGHGCVRSASLTV